MNGDGRVGQAPGAQLILYPQYPEVRLSGFLNGCPIAPSAEMQPIPRADRRFNNAPDGRILFFGVTQDRVYAYLATATSHVAKVLHDNPPGPALLDAGVLREIRHPRAPDPREQLLSRLRAVSQANPHASRRLSRNGEALAYAAPNGAGYTLEALLDIIPNGNAEPDFMGWEIKAYGRSRITLMTPEPNAGFYGRHGVEAFLRKYGRILLDDVIYFTGTHRANVRSPTSGHMLVIDGFDNVTCKITNVDGGIYLLDRYGEVSAGWTFAGLVEHWGRKHAAAAYIPYVKSTVSLHPAYSYISPVLMGEGTEFAFFLKALSDGAVIYDPAPKLERASQIVSRTKARSQFRISSRDIHRLYQKLDREFI